MLVSILPLLILFPVVFANTIDLSLHVENSCTGSVCELNLHPETIYSVSSPIILNGYNNVSIIGRGNSVVCFASKYITHIKIENVASVVVRGIRFQSCENVVKIIDSEYSYFHTSDDSFGLTIFSCQNVEIADSKFYNFSGSLLHLSHSKNVSVSKCHFEGNNDYLLTQGIFYTSPHYALSQLHIRDCNFVRLAARPMVAITYNISDLIDDVHYLSGAGIYLFLNNTREITIKIDNCVITECSAVSGAGIFLKSFTDSSDYFVSVRNSSFIKNEAYANQSIFVKSGGGINMLSLGSDRIKIRIENCEFISNNAYSGKGGAISRSLYAQDNVLSTISKLEIKNCSFINNSATTGGVIFVSGRGLNYKHSNLYDRKNSLIIELSNFTSNYADSGGVIFASMHHIVLDSGNNFTDNTCSVGCVFVLVQSHLHFNGNNFMQRNKARVFGGAIYIESSFISISTLEQTSYIRSNVAGMRGGAIYVNNNLLVPVETRFRHQMPRFSRQCFIRPSSFTTKMNHQLIFFNNAVEMFFKNTDVCLGNDIYSKTMFYCSDSNNGPLYLNSTLSYFERMGVIFNTSNCSISTDVSEITFDFVPMCKVNLPDLTLRDCTRFDPNAYDKYVNHVRSYIHRQKNLGNTTINIVFPGYISTLSLQLKDDFNQPTTFYAFIDFFPLSKDVSKITENTEYAPVSLYPRPNFWRPQTNYSIIFTHSTNKMQLVQMCIYSKPFFPIFSCTKLLVTTCPDAFNLKLNDVHKHACSAKQKKGFNKPIFEPLFNTNLSINGYPIQSATDVAISVDFPALIAMDDSLNSFVSGECEYYKCRCYDPQGSCTVNLLTPYEQCLDGLTGPYCTKCNLDNYLLSPPISIIRTIFNNCYPCMLPYLWVPLYFVITIAITALILSLRIDIFSDYTRSIAFYSSILYLYVVCCGKVGGELIFNSISLILSVSNLLVSENMPFCFGSQKNEIQLVTLFNNVSPFVYYFYLLIVYLLFQKIPYLQRYNLGKNIHFPMWTLFIITYSNLCVGAFVPFHYNDQKKWIYDSDFNTHTNLLLIIPSTIIGLFIVVIPILLVVLSYRARKRCLHLTENYEKRFKPGFKLWEVMKLSCRFFFALLFPIPYLFPIRFQILNNACLLVSVLCLFLLIINSLYQPATNHFANHFESYCLFILTILGILNISHGSLLSDRITGLLVVSPYVIFVIIKSYMSVTKLVQKLLNYKKQNLAKSIN